MGAAGSLARAIALAFAKAGADVALTTATSDGDEAFALRSVARAISDLGRRGLVEGVDMSLATSVQITVRQVAKALGGIDVLVAAPDFRLSRPAERLSDADWSKLINLNLSGVFFACRSVAREMLNRNQTPERERESGRIIVVTPALPSEASAAYRAAKAGLEGLVAALNDEWASKGIGVTLVVIPDLVDEAVANRAARLVLDLASQAKPEQGGRTLRAGV